MSFVSNFASYLNLNKKPREPKIFSRAYKIIVIITLLVFFIWILVYPSLSNIIFAVTNNIPITEVPFAFRNARLWQRNIDCFADEETFNLKIDRRGISSVELAVCPSSDIMVQVTRQNGKTSFHWVQTDNVQ